MDENKDVSIDTEKRKKEISPRSMRLSPATVEALDEAQKMYGGTQDAVLMAIVTDYIQRRKGQTISTDNSSYRECLKNFEESQSYQYRLLCTAIAQADADRKNITDRYEGLVGTANAKNESLVVSEKEARAEAEAAKKEAEASRKEMEAARMRIFDLEDKIAALKKSSTVYEQRITDLSTQLAANAEKISKYDGMLAESREKDSRIRDLEEQVRMLQKDLEHEKESAEQRIRIVELEAGRKIDEAGYKDSTDLPFN